MLFWSAVSAATLCEKYEVDLQTLAGGQPLKLKTLMSERRGSLDTTPSREIGCGGWVEPTRRQMAITFARPETFSTAEMARSNKSMYAEAGLNITFRPVPELGPDGYLSLETTLGAKGPNVLRVVGHTADVAVALTLNLAAESPRPVSEIAAHEIDSALAIVGMVLRDFACKQDKCGIK